MTLVIVLLILLSCYVAISDIADETKTSYFIVVTVLTVITLLVKILS